jgi:hypothetical protein
MRMVKIFFISLAILISGFIGYQMGCKKTYPMAYRTGRMIGIGMGIYHETEADDRTRENIENIWSEDMGYVKQHDKRFEEKMKKGDTSSFLDDYK